MTTTPNSNRMRALAVLVFLTLLNVLNFADRFLMQGFAVDLTNDLLQPYSQRAGWNLTQNTT